MTDISNEQSQSERYDLRQQSECYDPRQQSERYDPWQQSELWLWPYWAEAPAGHVYCNK